MKLPKHVTIVEVGPRDGLQNEPETIPTNLKVKFINHLAEAGLKIIEATSFVSPKWVPQMADHMEVMRSIIRKKKIHYPVLVPNIKGMHSALEVNVKDIAVFTAASETFSQKNTNCSITESIHRIKEVIELAKKNNITVRGYISCVLVCPYEGEIPAQKVADIAKQLDQLGCYEISLGDTIGAGTPLKTQYLIQTVSKQVPVDHLAVHFHDTYGQALVNIYAALQCGIHTIDSSVAGLGGCPYAPGASGNVATEDVVYMLNGMGIKTGVDLHKLVAAGRIILDYLRQPTKSKAAQAILS